MSKKNKVKDNTKVICDVCKEIMDFHMHDCGKTMSMYFGCLSCDNFCSKCKKKKDDSNES